MIHLATIWRDATRTRAERNRWTGGARRDKVARMKLHQKTLTLATQPRRLLDVTSALGALVSESGVRSGLCTILCRHTSAGLCIQENADPAVLRDLARFLERLAPESSEYEHGEEGPDDMPAHLRTLLTRTTESVPIVGGRLALGTWQAVYLWEHRARGRKRELLVTIVGE